ncbi:prolipoprotein diacylglyceryl transferase family protein [Microbispora sp. CA-102843]|uniref:prolipoprotein diacylglyceryl transferase family protein n=1 Tax=Microbispora sp. CA-102843 TaxID=3239952 RepID=UPI003D94D677
MTLAIIPSPEIAVWYVALGFIEISVRTYALCMISGIVGASIVTDRYMRSRGAPPHAALDIAVWAVPCGIVGALRVWEATMPSLLTNRTCPLH